jgi:hypothetical protein
MIEDTANLENVDNNDKWFGNFCMIASDVNMTVNGAHDGYNFKLSILYLEMAGKKLWRARIAIK